MASANRMNCGVYVSRALGWWHREAFLCSAGWDGERERESEDIDQALLMYFLSYLHMVRL
jgi:hypothetical protein